MKKILLLTIFISILSCKENNTKDKNDNQIKNENICELTSYDYTNVINYHKKGCLKTELPLIIKNDLNRDGINEEFLLTETYSGGGLYTLYQKKGKSWNIISDENNITINHLGVEIDSTSDGEWKNFKSFERLTEFTWVWKTNKYMNQ